MAWHGMHVLKALNQCSARVGRRPPWVREWGGARAPTPPFLMGRTHAVVCQSSIMDGVQPCLMVDCWINPSLLLRCALALFPPILVPLSRGAVVMSPRGGVRCVERVACVGLCARACMQPTELDQGGLIAIVKRVHTRLVEDLVQVLLLRGEG